MHLRAAEGRGVVRSGERTAAAARVLPLLALGLLVGRPLPAESARLGLRLPPGERSQHYAAFRAEQMQAAASGSAAELEAAGNIFYLTADEREWEQLQSLLGDYFARMAEEGFRPEWLAALVERLKGYNVHLAPSDPVGYYSLKEQRVYVDPSLFQAGGDPVFAKSVIYHEKIHEQQQRRLDGQALRDDQRLPYQEKLQEVGAHYNQIRWVMAQGDPLALERALANSDREEMFPSLLKYYPPADPVLQVIRGYQQRRRAVSIGR